MSADHCKVHLGDLVIHQDGDPGVVSEIADGDIQVAFLSGSKCVFDGASFSAIYSDIAYHFSRIPTLSKESKLLQITLREQINDIENVWRQLETSSEAAIDTDKVVATIPWVSEESALGIIDAYINLISNKRNLGESFFEAYCTGSLREFLQLCESVSETFDVPQKLMRFICKKKAQSILNRLEFDGMDAYQLEVCSKMAQNHLIKARAGSGKTLCVSALATLALKDTDLSSSQLMVLAFNKRAAREVRTRIKNATKTDDDINVRTFHSLAMRISRSKKRLIFDDGGLDISGHKQSRFAERVVRRILNPAFKIKLYLYFRKELENLEKLGLDLGPNDYFIFRRALEHFTLNGEKVKSNGEKYIADFLFEHGVDYAYEKVWDWKSKDFGDGIPYAPDFSISFQGKDFILEHWAVHPDDPSARLPDWWESGSAKDYQQQIRRKRAFWRERGVKLIETNTTMLVSGRESFERILKARLESAGIIPRKQSEESIVRRVFAKPHQVSRIARLFLGFVQKCKKQSWDPNMVKRQIENAGPFEEKVSRFYDLAQRFYGEYESALHEEDAIDFDDLLHLAIDEIHAKEESASLYVEDKSTIPLTSLRILLIDEFQDVSPLYIKMINSMRKFNPNMNLVCVGDDWQSINKFAGADISFFSRFKKYFRSSEVSILPVNHRSVSNVVALGNYIMRGNGEAGLARHDAELGEIRIKPIEDIFVSFSKRADLLEQSRKDRIYVVNAVESRIDADRGWLKKNEMNAAASLKAASEFIQDVMEKYHSPSDPVETVLVLSRTKYAHGLKIRDYAEKLENVLKSFGNSLAFALTIDSDTVHAAKGEGADIVVILDVTNRQFPKVHPDIALFELFGEDVSQNLEEERRLFYVAVTRCKRHLLMLTSQGEQSPFLPADNILDSLGHVTKVDPFAFEPAETSEFLRECEDAPNWILEAAKDNSH